MQSRRYNKASSRIGRREKTRRNFSLFLKVVVPLGLFIGAIFVLRVDFLQVVSFEISGRQTVLEENIKNAALSFSTGSKFWVVPKSNILLLDKNKLASALLADFGRIESVDINKNFFSRDVEIAVKERGSDFLWCPSAQAGSPINECYFMDRNGLVFERAFGVGDMIIFSGILQGDPVMQSLAAPEQMQNYIKLIESFKNADISIRTMEIESEEKGTAGTDQGDIIFNPQEDLSLTAQNVILLIKETKSKNPSATFEYIDARFGNKMFYKLK